MVGGTDGSRAGSLRSESARLERPSDLKRQTLRLLRVALSTSAAVCTTPFPTTAKASVPFNDVAVAVRVLQARGIERVGDDRSRRAPRQRHGVHFRIRSAVSSRSRCTSSTTTRCGNRAGRSTSGCPTACTTTTYLRRARRRAAARDGQHQPALCASIWPAPILYEDDQLGGLRLTKRWPAPARRTGDRGRAGCARARGRRARRRLRTHGSTTPLRSTSRQSRARSHSTVPCDDPEALQERQGVGRLQVDDVAASDHRPRLVDRHRSRSMSSSSSAVCGESGAGACRSDTLKKISSSSQ